MGNAATSSAGTATGDIKPARAGQAEATAPFGLTRQVRLLAGLLVFSLTLTLALLFWAAKSHDKITVDSSRQIADTAMGVQLSTLQKLLTDYTLWDDAYQKTVETFDPDWFDVNFGDSHYLRDTFGITTSFVIGPDDRVLRLMSDSEIVEGAEVQNFVAQVEGGLSKLVQQARDRVDGAFVALGGLVKVAGQPHFAAVRVIQPHTPEMAARTAITPANTYVAAFLLPLDQALLQSLARDFGLVNLNYAVDANSHNAVVLPLYGADGQQLGVLTWWVDLPSRHMFFGVLPALLAAILCIGLLSWYVLHSLRRGQTKLWQMMMQAQSADRAKTEFLANMSHELRTPLNAIIGFSEIMQSRAFGPLGSERYVEYNANIHNSGRHLLDIIDDVLDLSKVETGAYILKETEIELPALIESVCRLAAPRAAAKGVTLEVELAPSLPALRADESALKQILLNLLSNAIKFTPSEGRIVVELGCAIDNRFWLAVSDNGVGIPKEQLPLVMEPFHQVTGPLTASEGGTGLGLPLAASLVALHGAAIRIESEVGKGTAISVEFPPKRTVRPTAA